MDFSPNGELMALIDYYGVCIIPDVSTNEPRLHIEVGTLGKIETQTNFQLITFTLSCHSLAVALIIL